MEIFLWTRVCIWKLLQTKSIYQLEITVLLLAVLIYPKTTSRSGTMISVTTSPNLEFYFILHLSHYRVKWRCNRNLHPKSFKSLIVLLISVSLLKDTKVFMTLLMEVGKPRISTWPFYQNSPYLLLGQETNVEILSVAENINSNLILMTEEIIAG